MSNLLGSVSRIARAAAASARVKYTAAALVVLVPAAIWLLLALNSPDTEAASQEEPSEQQKTTLLEVSKDTEPREIADTEEPPEESKVDTLSKPSTGAPVEPDALEPGSPPQQATPPEPTPEREAPQNPADTPWPIPEEGEFSENSPVFTPASQAPAATTRDAFLALSVPKIGLRDEAVIPADGTERGEQDALRRGIMHVAGTDYPWDANHNVYLAGHMLGYPDTPSRLIFYRLPELRRGDQVVLKDREGRRFEYQVFDSVVVDPKETWVLDKPRTGESIVSLQTCVPYPTYENRLVVRAKLVARSR